MDGLRYANGMAETVLLLELGLGFCLLLLSLALSCLRGKTSSTLSRLALLLVLSLFFLNQELSTGRPVAAVGLVMPGSFITRQLILDLAPWLRRFVEPVFWTALLVIFAGGCCAPRRLRAFYFFSSGALLLLLAEECALLMPGVKQFAAAESGTQLIVLLHYLSTQVFLAGLMLVAAAELVFRRKAGSAGDCGSNCRRPWLLLLPAIVLACGGLCLISSETSGKRPRPEIGAHYYSWFPENWRYGDIGAKVLPPVRPLLGEYKSDDEQVIAQHAAWAKGAGISFFVFDWWPQRIFVRDNVAANAAFLEKAGQMKFSVMFESSDLKQPGDWAPAGEPDNVIYLTPQRVWRMKKHWAYLAKHMMGMAQYLRIEGRPVLFVYSTRHLVGPVGEAMQEARSYVKDSTGIDLYLAADEAFFNVVGHEEQRGFFLRAEDEPDWQRIAAFDALTIYNPYDSSRRQYAGQSGAPAFLADVEKLLYRYRAVAATAGLRLIPGVLAAYNDRGVRPAEDHFVVPRHWGEKEEKTFFAESLKRWGLSLLSETNAVMTITSWNEWNEGSQIEPAAASPATRRDISATGSELTQGESYEGYGFEHLEQLSQALRAYGQENEGGK